MPRRAEPARARRLSAPGAAARARSASPSGSSSARSRPPLIAALYADALPIALAVEPHPLPLLTAALAGLLTMVLFVLWPLGRAAQRLARGADARPSQRRARALGAGLMRSARRRPAWRCSRSPSPLPRSAPSPPRSRSASSSPFSCSPASASCVQRYAARFRRAKPPSLALALASIGGPGSLARSIAVSLGLGLGLLVAVALIHRSLLTEIDKQYRGRRAGLLLPRRRGRRPRRLPRHGAGHRARRQARRRADAARPHRGAERRSGREGRGRARFALGARRRPRPHLYRRRCRATPTIVEGEWWPKGYTGPPLVSFDAELAKGLGPEARRPHHREHSRPQCRGDHRLLAQDRLGIARHQFRHGVLAQHASKARRTACSPRSNSPRAPTRSAKAR